MEVDVWDSRIGKIIGDRVVDDNEGEEKAVGLTECVDTERAEKLNGLCTSG